MPQINKELLKKIGLGALIVGFAVLMGYLIYRIFFRPIFAPDQGATNTNATPSGTLPPTNTNTNAGVITTNINGEIITVLPAIDTVATGGNTLADRVEIGIPLGAAQTTQGLNYYDPASGQFYRLGSNREPELLTDDIYQEVENLTWSPDGGPAILELPDGSNVVYDFNAKKQITLPREMQEFSFAAGGDQIAFKYMTQNREDRWLGVASPDGSESKGVALLGDNADKVIVDYSPSGQVVATVRESLNAFENEIGFVGLNEENFKGIVVSGRGFQPQWSPNGSQLLYSVYNQETEYMPELFIVDALGQDIGRNNLDLGLRTWANKCTFSDTSTLYCAVPESLEYGAGLVPGVAAGTPDRIYKIDTQTGTRSIVANPVNGEGDNTFSVGELFISEDQKYLYFTDQVTGEVRKIKLF